MSFAVPRRPINAPIHKRPRVKDEPHLVFIRRLPCCVCGVPDKTEAAHVRMPSLIHGKAISGKAQKPSDRFTVPLCNDCHREQHGGSEEAFWSARGINAVTLSLALHGVSGDEEAGRAIVANAIAVAPLINGAAWHRHRREAPPMTPTFKDTT